MKLKDGYKLNIFSSQRKLVDQWLCHNLITKILLFVAYLIIIFIAGYVFYIYSEYTNISPFIVLYKEIVLEQDKIKKKDKQKIKKNKKVKIKKNKKKYKQTPSRVLKKALKYVNDYNFNSYIIIKEMYALINLIPDKFTELKDSIETAFPYMPSKNTGVFGFHYIM